MEPVRILIADDQVIARQGLKTLLSANPEIEIVGEATSGAEAVELAAALQPDVILMDLKMPGMSGIEATRRIHRTSPHIAILVVTMFADDSSVFPAIRAGARGYLLKDADQAELFRAIQTVAAGGVIWGGAEGGWGGGGWGGGGGGRSNLGSPPRVGIPRGGGEKPQKNGDGG